MSTALDSQPKHQIILELSSLNACQHTRTYPPPVLFLPYQHVTFYVMIM